MNLQAAVPSYMYKLLSSRIDRSVAGVYSIVLALLLATAPAAAHAGPASKGVLLERLTWEQAERVLTPEAVVVIPLGAASKEHGRHLLLNNDFRMAEYLKGRMLAASIVVVAPTIASSYYPAFAEYPGSISLSLETAAAVVVETCRSLARFGPRRFYVINTGVSTRKPLALAAETLAREGVLLRYTDLDAALGPTVRAIGKQEGGSHADEVETSIMLAIAPETVDMRRATKDYRPGAGPLTRDSSNAAGVYSPSGAWGDPTLATRAKGRRFVEALVAATLEDVEALRVAPLPEVRK